MTDIPSTEFWIAVLFIINFMVVVFLFLIVKKMSRIRSAAHIGDFPDREADGSIDTTAAAKQITGLFEPLLEESKQTALRFDEQIKEKKRLIKELNDALDSRIISINLLLSRADSQQKKLEDRQSRIREQHEISTAFTSNTDPLNAQVDDQQNRILSLYYQSLDVDTIARKLSIPKGEVQLVIDLKERFDAMEKESR